MNSISVKGYDINSAGNWFTACSGTNSEDALIGYLMRDDYPAIDDLMSLLVINELYIVSKF